MLLENRGDIEEARSHDMGVRFPCIEWRMPGQEPNVNKLAARPSKRLIRSHLKKKIQKALREIWATFIIWMRNIKDNLVSHYHFYESNAEYGCYQGIMSILKTF